MMRKKWWLILLIPLLLSGGCRADELEDRCFPLAAAVDKTQDGRSAFAYMFPTPHRAQDASETSEKIDTAFAVGGSFEQAWEQYCRELDKKPDENHLKVFVIGERFLDSQKAYDKMLDILRKREAFPRNTYVCLMKNPGKLVEIRGDLSSDAGTYLEEFLRYQKKENKKPLVTLGELMDDALNKKMDYELPYLVVKKGRIEWVGTYPILRGRLSGCVKR